jgi:PEP-CTERM motif
MVVAFGVSALAFINVGGIMISLNTIAGKAHATSKRAWKRSTSACIERQMNVASRLTAILGSMLVVIACSIGLPSQVNAISLTVGDSLTLGLTPGEPSSPTDEANYINFLIDMVPGTTSGGPSSPPNYTRTSNILCFPLCDDATATGSITDNSQNNTGSFGSGFDYLLGKYDGPNGGDVIWYVAGLTGTFDIPQQLAPNPLCTQGSCGLSHWALFNPDDGNASPTDKVPEPSTLLLFGAGLIVVSRFARKLK